MPIDKQKKRQKNSPFSEEQEYCAFEVHAYDKLIKTYHKFNNCTCPEAYQEKERNILDLECDKINASY